MRKILIATLFFSFINISYTKEKCIETRAAFDVGSGSTKMLVAKINVCSRIIIETLYEEKVSIPLKSRLAKSKDNRFDKVTMALVLNNLQKLKVKAKKYGATNFAAVATAAFRQAKNGMEAAKTIGQTLKIKFSMISQDREAILGYYAARREIGKKTDYVVWDIGGASMQMVYRGPDKSFNIFLGDLASVSFRNYVITKIKGKSLSDTVSPNPIGKDSAALLSKVTSHAKSSVSSNMKEVLKSKEVYGIGGVHYYSIKNQCASKVSFFTREILTACLKKRKDMSDSEVGGKYASTDITNIALVLGYMTALKIDRITPIKANMASGILLDPNIWK